MNDRADMDEFVSRVRAGSDIVAVVSGYTLLKRRGNRYWGCCPLHGEKTPSLSVEPNKGLFYCFGCHAGGNVFNFLSLIEGITYFEAIKNQAEKLGIPLPTGRQTKAEIAHRQRQKDLKRVAALAGDFFHNCLTLTRYGAVGLAYLKERGLGQDVIEEFKLGFAPDSWNKLTAAFRQRGIAEELLLESGLAARREQGDLYDRFRGRVMVPIANERGQVVGFGGRVLGDGTPKYLNSPETPIFNKRNLLFGLDKSHLAISQKKYAIIVEGYMDAISLYGAGIKNVVATLGTAFTLEQGKLLLRYTDNFYFCYDSDEAGQRATIRALALLKTTGAKVRVLAVPEGKDPDEFVRNRGAAAFDALVKAALPLVEYRLNYVFSRSDLNGLEGKSRALREIAPALAGMGRGAEYHEYRQRLAQQLMLDENIVDSELRRYLREPSSEETHAPKTEQRREQPTRDDAVSRAGRILIRTLWQERGLVDHAMAFLPLEAIAVDVQREILDFIRQEHSAADLSEEAAAAHLSEAAQAELSRSLLEPYAKEGRTKAYEDSLNTLRWAYLQREYERYTRLAQEYSNGGDMAAYQEAMQKARALKNEVKRNP